MHGAMIKIGRSMFTSNIVSKKSYHWIIPKLLEVRLMFLLPRVEAITHIQKRTIRCWLPRGNQYGRNITFALEAKPEDYKTTVSGK